jgi:hypothetical protein
MESLTPDQFAADFGDSFTRSAFRLELLDYYVAPNEVEPFRSFLAGEPPDWAWREPWKRFVRQARAAGRTMARVHVLSEPLSDYLRFELTAVYPANVDAGEDVRVLPASAAEGLELPGRDYWLLDSERVAAMTYDEAGNWLSVELTDAPDVVAYHCQARDAAMAHAIPLTTYLAETEQIIKETAYERRAS